MAAKVTHIRRTVRATVTLLRFMVIICGDCEEVMRVEDANEDEELNWGRSGLLAFVEGDMKEGWREEVYIKVRKRG